MKELAMQTLDRDELTAYINAAPEAVYAIVADVTRTPEYSPEVAECVWLDRASGPKIGARFKARNKVGRASWHNKPVITTAEPGREFAFARTEPFAGTLVWRYRFEPEGAGTRVRESYEVVRPITRIGWWIIESGSKENKNRRAVMHSGMAQSLQRLKALVEDQPR
jgi:hypothetical protein